MFPAFPVVANLEFRSILWFPGYAADSEGDIWTCFAYGSQTIGAEWRRLDYSVGKWGRKKYSLYRAGKSVSERGNILVALAFIGPIPKGMVVAHYPDRNPGNNRPTNLIITTHKVNAAHKHEQGTAQIGCENPNAKINEEIVKGLRQLHASGMKIRAIARATGLDRSMIKQVVKYETWRHVV